MTTTTPNFNANWPSCPKKAISWRDAGACAKFAWPPKAGGRGGARVIYLYLRHRDVIYLLYLFTKNDAANLSADGKKSMRQLAHEIKNPPFQP